MLLLYDGVRLNFDWGSGSSSFFSSFHLCSFIFRGGVTLEAIMAQLVWMDAHLDTFSDELCQVNTRVDRIAWQQAAMGGFIVASSLSPPTSEDESDDGSGNDDANEDDDASLPHDDEMSTLPFVTRDKKGE